MTVADWLNHKAEYTHSLGMSSVRALFEAGDLAGALRELARIAAREEKAAR